jgi:hypothetical protein
MFSSRCKQWEKTKIERVSEGAQKPNSYCPLLLFNSAIAPLPLALQRTLRWFSGNWNPAVIIVIKSS